MRKHVGTNSWVIETWLKQQQNEGRNPQRSLLFKGPSIYSYGDHFEMARFVKRDVILVTTERYSRTTTKHVSSVESMISKRRELTYFITPTFDNPLKNLEYFISEALRFKASQSRSRANWIGETYQSMMHNSLKEGVRYAECFNLSLDSIDSELLLAYRKMRLLAEEQGGEQWNQ